MATDLTPLEEGLLTILVEARISCHEPILDEYLRQSVGWAVAMLDRRRQILAGYDEWFQPDPEEAREAELRAWLQGE